MLLIVEEGMRDWICQPAHQNANVSKCIEDDDPLKRPPYLTDGQLGKNNQYGWVMSKTNQPTVSRGSKTHLNLMSIPYDESSDKGYSLAVAV